MRPVNVRITGKILEDDYESFIAKLAEPVGEYSLELEENVG